MGDLVKTATAVLAALAAVAAVVMYGQDRTILVPPPEAVAEQFTRQIAAKRYDRAIQYVSDDSGITEINARLAGDELHDRAGAVNNVEGEPGQMQGDRATASAVLITDRGGRVRYTFALVRRHGVWKIVEWGEP